MTKPPIGVAAGVFKSATADLEQTAALVSTITAGSFTHDPREGNPEPIFWYDERTGNSINAVGLRNQSLSTFLDKYVSEMADVLDQQECGLRLSVAPLEHGDLRVLFTAMERRPEAMARIREVEINIACPNRDAANRLHNVLAHDQTAVDMLFKEIPSCHNLNLSLKIAPNMRPRTLRSVARQACDYGFTSLVSGNTRRERAYIYGKERLSVEYGGMGGATLLEDGIKQVAALAGLVETYRYHDTYPVIIGCGGISKAEHVRRYLAAGATSVQVATLAYQFPRTGVSDLVTEYLLSEPE